MKRNLLYNTEAPLDTGSGGETPTPSMEDFSKSHTPPANDTQEDGGNTEVMTPPDWDKERNVSIEDFHNPSNTTETPKAKPTANEQSTKTGKEGEKKTEIEVQSKGEVQSGDDTQNNGDEQNRENTDQTNTTEQTSVITDPVRAGKQQQLEAVVKTFPEVQPFLKKMAPDAREFVVSRLHKSIELEKEKAEVTEALKQARSGKVHIPESLYENPNAYLLTPEYQQTEFATSLARQAYNHWNEQRRRILNGDPWFDIEEVRDAKGNIRGFRASDKEQRADGNAQAIVDEYWQAAGDQLKEFTGRRNAFITEFQTRSQEITSRIQAAVTELFPPDRWDKEGSNENNYYKYAAKGIRDLGITEHNPAFHLLAKVGGALLMERALRQSSQAGLKKREAIAADTRRAGPTGGTTTSGGGGGNGASAIGDNIDDFNRLLR